MQISSHKLIFGCGAIILAALYFSVTLGQITVHGCFPLYITGCEWTEYKIKCFYLPEKTPDTLDLNLLCHNGKKIKVLNATYSMPALPSLSCNDTDKNLDCNGSQECYCCTVPDKVCSIDSSNILLDNISNTCNNVTSCTVTVPRFQFKKTDCQTFYWQIKNYPQGHCDNNPEHCYSRWIDITYICHIPQDQTSSKECSEGTYGINCSESCSENCQSSCDHKSGRCLCKTGFQTQWCNETCSDGTFGPNCDSTCSINCEDNCRAKDGGCTCKEGYKGTTCDMKIVINNGITNHKVIIVMTVAVVVAIAIAVVIVISLIKVTRRNNELEDAINPYYQSTSKQVTLRKNIGYLPPLKKSVQHHYPSRKHKKLKVSELNTSALQYGDETQRTDSNCIYHSVAEKKEDGTYLDTSAIEPHYPSTSRQVAIQENNGYLPPLNKPIQPHYPLKNNMALIDSELSRSALLYEGEAHGTRSCSILQSVTEKNEDGVYLDTSAIDPYYQSTSRQVAIRENSGYLPPLKKPIKHHSSDTQKELKDSEPNRSILQYEGGAQEAIKNTMLNSVVDISMT